MRYGENGVIVSKIPRVEIIITLCTAIHIKNNRNFGSNISAIFYINCYYNFNPCEIFEKMTIFSNLKKAVIENVITVALKHCYFAENGKKMCKHL